MYWLRVTFCRWAEEQGIEFTEDDFKFIEKILNKLPETSHKEIMREFAWKWLDGIGWGEKEPPNQGEGRLKAFIWMIEMLEE